MVARSSRTGICQDGITVDYLCRTLMFKADRYFLASDSLLYVFRVIHFPPFLTITDFFVFESLYGIVTPFTQFLNFSIFYFLFFIFLSLRNGTPLAD